MKKVKCLIVDDELPALDLLTAYIDKLPYLHLVAACEGSMEALTTLRNEEVDLLFLDIHMPELSGLDLLKSLLVKPQVVMTTASREFAVEGFALDACDYLVKPFSFERFIQAVTKASGQLQPAANSATEGSDVLDESFFVKSAHKLEKLTYRDILYIESMREYVSIHTKQKRYLLHQSMNKMVKKLPAKHFMRVHRSYIVALEQIDAISGNFIQIKDKKIRIGASYRKALFARIDLL